MNALETIQDQAEADLRGVISEAKELAISEVCDAIAAAVEELRAIRFTLKPDHSLNAKSNEGAKLRGKNLAHDLMQNIAEGIPVDFAAVVDQADEDSLVTSFHGNAEDTVKEFVESVLEKWKYRPCDA